MRRALFLVGLALLLPVLVGGTVIAHLMLNRVTRPDSFRAGSDRGAEREPDLPAIDRFLAARYRHYLDDIQHPEVFAAEMS